MDNNCGWSRHPRQEKQMRMINIDEVWSLQDLMITAQLLMCIIAVVEDMRVPNPKMVS